MANTLTPPPVRELLHYNPSTGVFKWLAVSVRMRPSGIAGCIKPDGYRQIKINKKTYLAHRLAWLYVYGHWPSADIDHINGDRLDNSIQNLRDVCRLVNTQNLRKPLAQNKLGILGVFFDKQSGKFRSFIRVSGKKKYLGGFADPMDAHDAYVRAKRIYHEGCTL